MQIIRKQSLFLGQKYVDEITKYKIAKNTRDFKNFISFFCIAVGVVVVLCLPFCNTCSPSHQRQCWLGCRTQIGSEEKMKKTINIYPRTQEES